MLEEEINLKAQKLTIEYLKQTKGTNSNNLCGDDLSEKVFIVYKFVHTPKEALIAGM